MSVALMNVQLRCRCGSVHGIATHVSPRGGFRATCYCNDCWIFAHYLGTDLLDDHGGIEVYQMPPAHVRIEKGYDWVGCLRLSPDGLYRFYTLCCHTPIGDMAGLSMPFVCVFTAFMDLPDDDAARDALLGRNVGVNGRSAPGGLPPGAHPWVSIGTFARTVGRIARSWITRKHLPSPFFDSDGVVRFPVTVLSLEERERLSARAATAPTPATDAAPDRRQPGTDPVDHLVFYGVDDADAEPAPHHRRLVVAPPHSAILSADKAPAFTRLRSSELKRRVRAELAKNLPEARSNHLYHISNWVTDGDAPFILYRLEPASTALGRLPSGSKSNTVLVI